MLRKTEGVELLVRDVLQTFSEPYGEDIIEEVCLAIKDNPVFRRRYDELSGELRHEILSNVVDCQSSGGDPRGYGGDGAL